MAYGCLATGYPPDFPSGKPKLNSFTLRGDYIISFTGMRVLKDDGSQLHGIGILPDVYTGRIIEGVRAVSDKFLEKAVELTKQ